MQTFILNVITVITDETYVLMNLSCFVLYHLVLTVAGAWGFGNDIAA